MPAEKRQQGDAHNGQDEQDREGFRSGGPRSEQLGVWVEVKPDREQVIVEVGGEIDLATAEQVNSAVMELLDGGFGKVLLDLRSVSFLDSTGISMLVACHKHARELGAEFVVAHLRDQPLRTLDLVGVIELLEIEPE